MIFSGVNVNCGVILEDIIQYVPAGSWPGESQGYYYESFNMSRRGVGPENLKDIITNPSICPMYKLIRDRIDFLGVNEESFLISCGIQLEPFFLLIKQHAI